jgi:hypothetical protein
MIESNTYVKSKKLELMSYYFFIQSNYKHFGNGCSNQGDVVPWSQNPWRSSWLKKRIWICPICLQSTVSCPCSLFQILTFKIYLHYNDVRTYNVLIKFDVIHKTMLWESMNTLVANMTMISNHLMEMDVNVNVSKTPLQSPCLSL